MELRKYVLVYKEGNLLGSREIQAKSFFQAVNDVAGFVCSIGQNGTNVTVISLTFLP